MLANRELREYEPSSTQLTKTRVNIPLRNHDIHLTLEVPDYGVVPLQFPTLSSSQVLEAHTEFKKFLEPKVTKDDNFYNKCAAEVNVINLFFPNVESPSIRICFTAWLVFVISMDDILEKMPPLDGEIALLDSIQIIRSLPVQERNRVSIDTRIQSLTRALHGHCTQWLSQGSAKSFFEAACEVFQAHINEIRFLQGRIPKDLSTYMGIRVHTIALDPFFDIIKSEFLPEDIRSDSIWDELQTEVCRAAGLQNDLVGLERDLENGEPLNAVVVLMASNGGSLQGPGEALFARYVGQMSAEHNRSTARAIDLVTRINEKANTARSKQVVETAQHILLLCETHLKWCTTAKRYHMKAEETGIGSV
ncbi:isoprenoid synthase domain-containing protein [Xylaria longipes]|nr:isoprenoid synthase domain-containing protein [Xylaria longipes]RYC57547.1 hypothetical protein CHU98_g8666 [Xylaria longipes]